MLLPAAGREERRVSREAGARLAALRGQDYEEYLRLTAATKDRRLRTLLDKTDGIISELGLKVMLLGAALWLPLLCHTTSIGSVWYTRAQLAAIRSLSEV